ncbi:hypothetical protein [Actinopolymorpha pittospori]
MERIFEVSYPTIKSRLNRIAEHLAPRPVPRHRPRGQQGRLRLPRPTPRQRGVDLRSTPLPALPSGRQ